MLGLLGLMETFFLFWCSVVGSVVVLMVGLLMVVDILCIEEKFLTERFASTARMRMDHAKPGNAVQTAQMVWRMRMEHAPGNAVQHPALMVRIRMDHVKPGNAVQTAQMVRRMRMEHAPGNAVQHPALMVRIRMDHVKPGN